jgi:hypothetical protein
MEAEKTIKKKLFHDIINICLNLSGEDINVMINYWFILTGDNNLVINKDFNLLYELIKEAYNRDMIFFVTGRENKDYLGCLLEKCKELNENMV